MHLKTPILTTIIKNQYTFCHVPVTDIVRSLISQYIDVISSCNTNIYEVLFNIGPTFLQSPLPMHAIICKILLIWLRLYYALKSVRANNYATKCKCCTNWVYGYSLFRMWYAFNIGYVICTLLISTNIYIYIYIVCHVYVWVLRYLYREVHHLIIFH